MRTAKQLLITVAVLLCSTVASAHDFEVGGIYYNIISSSDLTVAVTYKGYDYSSYDDEYSGAVVIPATVIYNSKTYSVTTIGGSAFARCTGLTSVTIPNSVTTIGGSAFYNTAWYNNQPDGLVYAGKVLYKYKGTMLQNTSIVIEDGTLGIAGSAFFGCTGLTSVTIPNSVTTIGSGAFGSCTGLTSVTIPNSVTTIEYNTFEDCTGLTSVTIGNSVTTIGFRAFDDTAWYNNQPDGLVYAGKVLYKYKGTMPQNTSIVIENGTIGIADSAFSGCDGLTSVTIPNSVTTIGSNAFLRCTGLKEVRISDLAAWCKIDFEGSNPLYYANNLYLNGELVTELAIPNGVTEIKNYAFWDCESLTSIEIPNSVTSIGEYAFRECTGLTSVTIPNSVTTIGNYAFRECTGLTSVKISNGVTTIGGSAFYNCTGLTSITIPNSVTTIGGGAFSDCYGLTSVTIPNSVTTIGDCAFADCLKLKEVRISDLAAWCKIDFESSTSNPLDYANNLYLNGELVTELVIPNGVTEIKNYAFWDCESLTSIEIPNSVTTIGDHAFYYCTGLKTVYNFSSLTLTAGSSANGYVANYADKVINAPNSSIEGDYVFGIIDGVNTLCVYIGNGGDIVLPADYKGKNYVIGANAFRNCTGLKSIEIPGSVTSIEYDAFYNCTDLKKVRISDLAAWCGIDFEASTSNPLYYANNLYLNGELVTELVIPNGVTEIKNYAFRNCSRLTSVTIPNSVTTIGGGAFDDCTGLTSVTIPNSVTTIGDCAFYNCDGLTSVTIPNSVTTIGDHAFYNCRGLTSVTIGNSVTSIEYHAFRDCTGLKTVYNFSSLTLTVGSSANGLVAYYADKVINAPNGSIEGDYVFGIIDGVNTLCVYIGNGGDIVLPADYKGKNYVIGANAFRNCTGFTSVTVEGGNAVYDSRENCNAIIETQTNTLIAGCKNTIIPNSVTTIGEYAFNGCKGLTSVTIPNSVTTIGESAFRDCTGLKTVCNFSSLTLTVGSSANGYVAYYADKVINAPNVLNGSIEGDYVFGIIDGVNTLCGYIGNGGDIVLPADYKGKNYVIGANAFRNCSSLTSVTIPNSVTTIERGAFSGCSSLTSVTIPNSVTTIGYEAFYGCTGLTSVTIPNSVTTIGDWAFYGCTGLTSVTIGNSVTTIGDRAFSDCDIAKTIWLTNTPPSGYSYAAGKINYVANNQYTQLSNVVVYPYLSSIFEVDGIKYVPVSPAERTCDAIDCIYDTAIETVNIGKTVLYKNIAMNVKEVMPYTCYKNKNIRNLTISNEGSLGDKAFYGCTSVAAATLGDGITSIGESAFYGCSSLEEVVIPNSVTSLNSSAFYNCSALNSVVLSDSIKTIGEYAFSGCDSLPEIKIPQAVAEIGNYAFAGCSSLANVIVEDRTAALSLGSNGSSPLFADCPLDSVYIGGKISYKTSSSYGYSPFYRNSSLRSVVITDVEEQIYDNEFYGCTGLKNVQIGNVVKSIGKWAFSGCSNLDYLIVGANVSSIGQEAFSDCSNVTTIYAHAMVPPVCEAQALEDINKWNCTLMVPNESIAEYQAAEQWKDFFFISNIPTGITEISPDATDGFGNGVIYDLYGRPVSKPAKGGIYIIGGKKVVW